MVKEKYDVLNVKFRSRCNQYICAFGTVHAQHTFRKLRITHVGVPKHIERNLNV